MMMIEGAMGSVAGGWFFSFPFIGFVGVFMDGADGVEGWERDLRTRRGRERD